MLRRICTALGHPNRSPDELAELEGRIARPPIGPRPSLGDDLVRDMVAKAKGNLFTVERIASLQMLVPAVRALLPPDLTPDISVAPALKHLGWPADWKINFGPGRRTEYASVTHAVSGIAETGTVVLQSGPTSPTTLNFLPDLNIVVLRTADIVAHVEDAYALVCKDGEDWPRTVNLIAGPSRTADVGGVIVRPAHGPKAVHLILCDS